MAGLAAVGLVLHSLLPLTDTLLRQVLWWWLAIVRLGWRWRGWLSLGLFLLLGVLCGFGTLGSCFQVLTIAFKIIPRTGLIQKILPCHNDKQDSSYYGNSTTAFRIMSRKPLTSECYLVLIVSLFSISVFRCSFAYLDLSSMSMYCGCSVPFCKKPMRGSLPCHVRLR